MTVVARETYINTRTHCMDLNSADKVVQSLDLSGSVIDVSPAWLELTGYEREEVIGKHFMQFLAMESLLCVEKNFPYLKDFGYVNEVPLKIRTKDNETLTVSLTGTSKYDQDGKFERTFCELTLAE
ncbi:PAS domain-containing protein [Vibrio sp. JC009]|uniref:PAS domain-containing protein n=1 Tax=Vibrio sp. JC009 TaxID=2912314 RepID=UPI0023B20465|nr:PAS domain-containing protein [Vibrio sp. JC009]WED20748.1 PAS domain-containing protein [Vibrio sp. JC009]